MQKIVSPELTNQQKVAQLNIYSQNRSSRKGAGVLVIFEMVPSN